MVKFGIYDVLMSENRVQTCDRVIGRGNLERPFTQPIRVVLG